jgi:hypothetical protein
MMRGQTHAHKCARPTCFPHSGQPCRTHKAFCGGQVWFVAAEGVGIDKDDAVEQVHFGDHASLTSLHADKVRAIKG